MFHPTEGRKQKNYSETFRRSADDDDNKTNKKELVKHFN